MAKEEEKQRIKERQKGYRADEIIVTKAVEPILNILMLGNRQFNA